MEISSMRWRPILGVESIIISVISMLCDPNIDSPANIDAAVLFRDNRTEFIRKCKRCVRDSQEA
jgi:ubiquitin-conjugating enzyme E2 G1